MVRGEQRAEPSGMARYQRTARMADPSGQLDRIRCLPARRVEVELQPACDRNHGQVGGLNPRQTVLAGERATLAEGVMRGHHAASRIGRIGDAAQCACQQLRRTSSPGLEKRLVMLCRALLHAA